MNSPLVCMLLNKAWPVETILVPLIIGEETESAENWEGKAKPPAASLKRVLVAGIVQNTVLTPLILILLPSAELVKTVSLDRVFVD